MNNETHKRLLAWIYGAASGTSLVGWVSGKYLELSLLSMAGVAGLTAFVIYISYWVITGGKEVTK